MWSIISAFLAPIGAFLKAIPWKAWAALILFALILLAFKLYGDRRYEDGVLHKQGQWDDATTLQAESDRIAKDQQQQVSLITVTEYVDRWHTIKVKGDTITREVTRYVPIGSPDLPGGFRLLHDAAAENQLPPPPGSIEAAPVGAQDTAATVIDNYTACHLDHAGYDSLWQWAEGQAAVGVP